MVSLSCEGHIYFIPCVDRNKAIYLIFKCIFIKVESCYVAQAGLEHLVFLPLYSHYFSHGCDQILEEVCIVSQFEGAQPPWLEGMVSGRSVVALLWKVF